MAIFTRFGLQGAFTIAHVVVAIMWMGLLWFFNFVQTPAYAEMDGAARTRPRPTCVYSTRTAGDPTGS